jgi:hypothetical protein
MGDALQMVNEGHTIRSAAKVAGVNFVTLSRRVKKKDQGGYKKPRNIFTDEEEKELQDYLLTCSRMCHGLTPLEVRNLAFSYADANNKTIIPELWTVKTAAGKDWLTGFLKHNAKLSIRKPVATSLGRLPVLTNTM